MGFKFKNVTPEVKVLGIPKAIKNIEAYRIKAKMRGVTALHFMSLRITKDAKQKAPRDLGGIRSNIDYKIREWKWRVRSDIKSDSEYASAVEFGTGKRSKKMPWQPIYEWSMRHGANPGAVYNKIMKQGTEAQPYMMPAYDKVKPKVTNIFRWFFR